MKCCCMDSESNKFGRGPRELTGAVDLITRYKLVPHHEFFCKKSLPVPVADTHYLHNVVGDTNIRKGEGMQLDQLIENPSLQDGNTRIQPFDLDTLRAAFHLKEMTPVELPSAEKGIPTIAGKSRGESKDKEKKHKKHKDKDKEKEKDHKKHKHRHKDGSKDKDEEKKDKSWRQDSGGAQSKKHHEKTTDSCKDNINFNDIVTFDTTTLSCQLVWPNQGFLLRYALAGPDVWSFLLSAPNKNTWLAIGFSKSGLMVGSSAVVGWVYQNGTGLAKQYLLKQQDSDQVLPDQGDLMLVDNSTTAFMQSNVLYLAFQLNTAQPLTQIIYAAGPYGGLPDTRNGFKLTQHRDQISTALNYATGSSATQSSPYTGLRRTHGALNMVGWGILIPMGVIVARYFKEWDPLWYYTHAAIQCFGWLFGLVGFILGFVTQGFINAKVDNHKRLGITILIMGCFQVTALLVRPQKGSKYQKYWNLFHHNAGRILIILAISNIFYGIRLGMEGPSWYVTYAVILGFLVISAVGLEIRACRKG